MRCLAPIRWTRSKMYDEYAAAAEQIRPFAADTGRMLNNILAQGGSIMFEGAQGTMLDIDHGTYPLCDLVFCHGWRSIHRNRRWAHRYRNRDLRYQGLCNARGRGTVPHRDSRCIRRRAARARQ